MNEVFEQDEVCHNVFKLQYVFKYNVHNHYEEIDYNLHMQ